MALPQLISLSQKTQLRTVKNEIFAGGSRENAPGSEKKEILSF